MADHFLTVTGLAKSFDRPHWRRSSTSPSVIRPAVVDVSFSLDRGETLGIVGESGSGKSTLAKCLVLLERPDRGSIKVDGTEMTSLKGAELRRQRRRVQIIFQDPYSSLNPRLTVGDALTEVLLVHNLVPRRGASARVRELLDLVGLPANAIGRYPKSFSGGQRQRICLARALAAEPDILIADEPVSSLDVSIQAQILNLLLDLRDRLGLATLFISHNLFVVQYVAPRITIMFGGRMVETLEAGLSLAAARHPYTQALLAAAPTLAGQPAWPNRELLNSNPFGALPLVGCPYRERCPHAYEPCLDIDPPALPVDGGGHLVACHYVTDEET